MSASALAWARFCSCTSGCASAAVLRSPQFATRRPRPPASASIKSRIKLLVYVVAATFAGLVGGLIILQKLRITPAAGFSVLDWSANVIFIVVIGGIDSLEGPIVGAVMFFLLRGFLADYGSWCQTTSGTDPLATLGADPRSERRRARTSGLVQVVHRGDPRALRSP